MRCDKKDLLLKNLLLYAVTDRSWLNGAPLYHQVEQAILGGATFVQLREKELDERHFLEEAKEIKELCRKYHVPFVVNDNVEIAARIEADGVHVGQSDMEAGDVRQKLGPDKIIGVSAQTVEQALLAQKMGADYLGVGAVFHTGSKADADDVSHETLRAICEAVRIPVIAIGGIGANNVLELSGSGICGIAVISAIFAQPDIRAATARLKVLTEEMVAAEVKEPGKTVVGELAAEEVKEPAGETAAEEAKELAGEMAAEEVKTLAGKTVAGEAKEQAGEMAAEEVKELAGETAAEEVKEPAGEMAAG